MKLYFSVLALAIPAASFTMHKHYRFHATVEDGKSAKTIQSGPRKYKREELLQRRKQRHQLRDTTNSDELLTAAQADQLRDTTNSDELLTAAQALVSAAVSQAKEVSMSLEKDQAKSLGEIRSSLEGLNRSSSEDLGEIKQKLDAVEVAIVQASNTIEQLAILTISQTRAIQDSLRIQFALSNNGRGRIYMSIWDEYYITNLENKMEDMLWEFLDGRGCDIEGWHGDCDEKSFHANLKSKVKSFVGGEPRIEVDSTGKPTIWYR